MKKIFVSFLSLMLAGQVWAQEFTVGNFNFTIIEDADNEVLVGKAADYNPVGALEIPSTVEIDSIQLQASTSERSIIATV